MSSRKTLKSVSVEGLKPTITLTPVIELCGEGYRIHHIKSDSIARDGRDTFVPLRYVSKQQRRIFELEEENAKLLELVEDMFGYAVKREMELCNACSCADGDFADCSACDEYDGACGIAKKRFEELYADRMRERESRWTDEHHQAAAL